MRSRRSGRSILSSRNLPSFRQNFANRHHALKCHAVAMSAERPYSLIQHSTTVSVSVLRTRISPRRAASMIQPTKYVCYGDEKGVARRRLIASSSWLPAPSWRSELRYHSLNATTRFNGTTRERRKQSDFERMSGGA